MIKANTVRVKTLAYSTTYDYEASVVDYSDVSYAQSGLPIVDGGFYEVIIDLRTLWGVGGWREIYNSGSPVSLIDSFSSDGDSACGVHKYYIKRNGATISSAAHPDNPIDEVGLFYPGKDATTYGSSPNVVSIPSVNMLGFIKSSLTFSFGLDGSNNLKIITPAMLEIDGTIGGVIRFTTRYFNIDGSPVPNGDYWKIHNSGDDGYIVVYTRIRLNRIT